MQNPFEIDDATIDGDERSNYVASTIAGMLDVNFEPLNMVCMVLSIIGFN